MLLESYNRKMAVIKLGYFMTNFASIVFIIGIHCCFVCTPFLLHANTVKFNTIVIEGNSRISDGAIKNYSQLRVSEPTSAQDLNNAYSRVIGTGLFKNVEFKETDEQLTIFVEEYPTINEISIEGNTKFVDEKLLSVLKSKPRFVFAPKVLEQDLTTLQKLYKDRGMVAARIQPKTVKLSDNRVNLIFEIFEGKVVEIEKINFVGNRTFSDGRLRRVLSSKQAGVFRKLIQQDTLIREKVDLDRRLLTNFYKNRGFVDFRINDVNTELSEEKDGFFITYNVTEGPQFRVGNLSISSEISEVDPAMFAEFSKLRTGDVYNASLLKFEVLKLENKLKSVGLHFVRADPNISRNAQNLTLNVALVLKKADRLFVERIDISGNTATLDRVLRRQFFFVEGDPFNPREIKAAEDRIKALGLFSNVSVDVKRGGSKSEVIVDVNVIEKPTGSLTFGAGYSSATGLGGLIEYGEKNFLGRGQALSFAINTGKNNKTYELSFYEPMFMRNDLGFGFNISQNDTNQQNAAYDTENLKLQPYIMFPLGERSKIKIDYSISQTDLSNPGNVGSIITDEVNEGSVTSSSVGYTYSHDTRLYNSSSDSGLLIQLGQQFTGLGGDKTALKTALKAAAYRTTFNEEVKLKAVIEAGSLTYTSGDSRVTERFSLGSRKMRGFKAGGLGPRECLNQICGADNNDALGGENFAVARFEAEFPLGLPQEYGMTGGLFYDIGNLWSLSKVNNNVLYEEGAWRQAIGASLFWKTPIGPLRFNFSEVLVKELYDKDESFDLTISTRF